MISTIKSDERHYQDHGWLQTRWHFSFSDYHDPENVNFGPLRVFNDDVVQPGQGFGMHPHKDMEIITYVLEGQLEHRDHLGNRGVINPGEVQVMSAGKGIMHSEFNHSKETPVHLLQLWVIPRSRGNKPRWEQKQFAPEERRGKLLPVVSGDGTIPGTLGIDQDAAIYVSSLKSGESVKHAIGAGRRAFLFVISGRLSVNGKEHFAGDQARIEETDSLELVASEDAELILLDLP
jgi:redox-sensitive bicupin YhaK (pirin superfamily)